MTVGDLGTTRNSSDGLTWVAGSGLGVLNQSCIGASANGFFCSGELFRPFFSTDGSTFSTILGVSDINDRGLGAAFGNGFGVMVGRFDSNNSARVSSTTPPFNGTGGASGNTSARMRAVAFSSGTRFVSVGEGGAIQTADVTTTSPTWAASASPTSAQLNGLAFGSGRFVAVGNAGTVCVSTDNGATFTTTGVTSGTSQNLNAVAFGNGRFVAVGDSGTTLTSTDGLTWVTISSGTSAQLLGVACSTANRFVAVGAGGVILSTP